MYYAPDEAVHNHSAAVNQPAALDSAALSQPEATDPATIIQPSELKQPVKKGPIMYVRTNEDKFFSKLN